ncbi:MAG: hypothetical protein GOU98_01320 [Candidatus Altiarchaeota archaeon]|nr:hypothetical protein [Candidatus Altiarchaeota archaeon]
MNNYAHLGSDENGVTYGLGGCLGLIIFTPDHGAIMHYGNTPILLSSPYYQRLVGVLSGQSFSDALDDFTHNYPQVKNAGIKRAVALYPKTYTTESKQIFYDILFNQLGDDLELKELPYDFSEDKKGHFISLSMKTASWESSLGGGSFETYL